MKLKLEDKLKIIELYEEGFSISTLSKKYHVSTTTIEKIERQYREHGLTSFKRKDKNNKYSPDFKMEIVNRILNGESLVGLAAELCISKGMIYSWFKKYQELGYNGLISKPKGRPKIMKPETKKITQTSEDEKDKRIRELEERNAQLEMENDLLKKLKALVQQRTQQQNKKK